MLDGEDEDLAVADLAGLGEARDRPHHLVDLVAGDRDLDLELGQEAHGVLGAPIDFGVALLSPVALHLGVVQLLYADSGEGVMHLVKFERPWPRRPRAASR